MTGSLRSKSRVQNDLRFHHSPPLRLTSKLPLALAVRSGLANVGIRRREADPYAALPAARVISIRLFFFR
jgi:hypothetical protein